jgi:Ca2+-binding RTX toxin-like protein
MDRITDFTVAKDHIQLENGIFTKLGSGSPSSPKVLGASHFFVGPAAHDGDDFVIYNPATGALSYDADGSGSGVAVTFAQLTAGLSLTHSDLFVV